jgi:DNA-binding NarL/FixJ family response regulator
MKIAIVDDHVLFREGIAAIIRSEPDIEIVGMAGTVKEAVELVRAVNPEIVLMDFMMPDGNGVDATRMILAEHPACKIIFLTMSEEDNDLFAAIRGGAKGYLLKNIKPSALLAAIHSVQEGGSALSQKMTLRLMDELSHSERHLHPTENTLTLRELDVLQAIATGLSNQEIARQLFISENTVKFHVHALLTKLNLGDRKEAARYAREKRLVK